MANQQHIDLLSEGEPWVNLKGQYIDGVHLDLSGADLRHRELHNIPLGYANLSGADLSYANMNQTHLVGANLKFANLESANMDESNMVGANLSQANLINTKLRKCILTKATLSGANLAEACLQDAILDRAKLSGSYCAAADFTAASLIEADLSRAYLGYTKFQHASMRAANLKYATLVKTNISGTDLSSAFIYGVSAWDVEANESTSQQGLYISREPSITVDDLEVAQFVNLCLNNAKIRNVIDTLTAKTVLVLGRFTPERKPVLDALRQHLRQRNYVSVLFDFNKPRSRSFIDTVAMLARLARFVIADITDAKVVLQELESIKAVPVPVQIIFEKGSPVTGSITDFSLFPWFLPPLMYVDQDQVVTSIDKFIGPAQAKANQLHEQQRKNQRVWGEYLITTKGDSGA